MSTGRALRSSAGGTSSARWRPPWRPPCRAPGGSCCWSARRASARPAWSTRPWPGPARRGWPPCGPGPRSSTPAARSAPSPPAWASRPPSRTRPGGRSPGSSSGTSPARAETLLAAGGHETEFRLVDAMVVLVEELCAKGPVALALDDLQWADPSTLHVLHRLGRSVRQFPLLLCGACDRTAPTRPDAAPASARAAPASRRRHVDVPPLAPGRRDPAALRRPRRHPGPRLVRQAATTGGNPFYVTGLVAALRASGSLVHDGDVRRHRRGGPAAGAEADRAAGAQLPARRRAGGAADRRGARVQLHRGRPGPRPRHQRHRAGAGAPGGHGGGRPPRGGRPARLPPRPAPRGRSTRTCPCPCARACTSRSPGPWPAPGRRPSRWPSTSCGAPPAATPGPGVAPAGGRRGHGAGAGRGRRTSRAGPRAVRRGRPRPRRAAGRPGGRAGAVGAAAGSGGGMRRPAGPPAAAPHRGPGPACAWPACSTGAASSTQALEQATRAEKVDGLTPAQRARVLGVASTLLLAGRLDLDRAESTARRGLSYCEEHGNAVAYGQLRLRPGLRLAAAGPLRRDPRLGDEGPGHRGRRPRGPHGPGLAAPQPRRRVAAEPGAVRLDRVPEAWAALRRRPAGGSEFGFANLARHAPRPWPWPTASSWASGTTPPPSSTPSWTCAPRSRTVPFYLLLAAGARALIAVQRGQPEVARAALAAAAWHRRAERPALRRPRRRPAAGVSGRARRRPRRARCRAGTGSSGSAWLAPTLVLGVRPGPPHPCRQAGRRRPGGDGVPDHGRHGRGQPGRRRRSGPPPCGAGTARGRRRRC